MIAVSDTRTGDDVVTSAGPCFLTRIPDETARRRGAAVAHALASARDVQLLIPDGDSPTNTEAAGLPESHRSAYRSATTAVSSPVDLQPVVRQQQPSALVLPRGPDATVLSELLSDPAERFADQTDVLTVDSRGQTDTIASILVAVAGGQHSQLAIEAAHALAVANDAAIDLFHVIESESQSNKKRGHLILEEAEATLGGYELADTWLYEAENTADAIIEQSEYYDLTVMGAPTIGPLERFVFGSTSKNVQREAASPVIVAHAHRP